MQALERFLLVAALIYFISGDFDLALYYLLSKGHRLCLPPASSFKSMIDELWLVLFEEETFALTLALELCFSSGWCRIQAEQFIMEAILVGRIMDASCRGLALPLHAVIDEYIALWMNRSVPDGLVPMLARLTYHANARRKFGVRLRKTWNLHIGALRAVNCHDDQSAQQKVHVVLRSCMLL
jgi:hypothetical protein